MRKRKPPLIHNDDMFTKFVITSLLVMWLKGGRIFILLMWIYFFICEYFERKNYKRTQKKRDEIGNRRYY